MGDSQITPSMESVDAKKMYQNDLIFHRFVDSLIAMMKDNDFTPEQIVAGCVLAIGEFEFNIEIQPKQNG